MFRSLTTLVCALALAPAAYAQADALTLASQGSGPLDVRSSSRSLEVGADAGLAVPMGDVGDELGLGFALQARLLTEVIPGLSVGGTVGYARYGLEDRAGIARVDGSVSVMPFVGTARWSFGGAGDGLYAGSDLGLYRLGFTVDYEDYGYRESSYSRSTTELGMAPFVGYRATLDGGLAVDLGAKLTIVDTSGVDAFKSSQLLAGISKAL